MKTLRQIFLESCFPSLGVTEETLLWFETKSDKDAILLAMQNACKEALKNASENAEMIGIPYTYGETEIDKQSILDENNIPKI